MFVLALPAGHLADRLPRRLVFAGALLLGVAVGLGLALLSWSGVTSVLPYLALAAGAGVTMALGTPAARAMAPTLVPADVLPSAMTLRSIATQAGQVPGPALGGLIYGISPAVVYLLTALMCLLASGSIITMSSRRGGQRRGRRARHGAARPEQRAGRAALRRPDSGPARRDPAGPPGRPVRRGRGAASRLRPLDPAYRPGRAGPPAGRARGRRAARRGRAHRPAADAPRRAHPARGRGAVRGEHHRLRAVPLLSPVDAGARRQRLRRHVQHEHPVNHRGAGHPRPAARPRLGRRDGVHQRLQPARCL